jgi:hypothetical protein
MIEKRGQLIRPLIVGVLALFAFLLQPYLSWTQKVEIKTENGVIVVRNPKTPVPLPGVPSTIFLKEDLVIGKETEKEDYWFSRLNSIAVDDSGNIYTLDPKDIKIRVFDPKGKLLRTFGQKGQGPGEFGGPGSIEITSDGILVVHDVLHRRLSYLTLDGKSIKDVSIAAVDLIGFKIDNNGFLYFYKIERGYKMAKELVKFDPGLNPVMKIHSFEWVRKPRVINAFPKKYCFDVTKEDNLIWLLSSTYEMHVVNPKGKTVKRIIKDFDPVKITARDKERFTKKELFRLEFPENYPVVDGLSIDDRDRIYVRSYEKDGKGGIYYDVFDPEGRYIARFSLPESDLVAVVKNNMLYCMIRESEEGFPLIKRYALEWK